MAQLFPVKSKCVLCRKVIELDDEAFLFPPFIQNTKDQLYQFNDASVHISCLNESSLGIKATQFSSKYISATTPKNRTCIVSGEPIDSSENYIFISLLTSNEVDELYDFSFLTLDRNNIRLWKDREKFIALAEKFKEEEKWGNYEPYKYLDDIINILKH